MLSCQSLEHRRAILKWPVRFSTGNGPMEGVTLTVSSKGVSSAAYTHFGFTMCVKSYLMSLPRKLRCAPSGR